MTSPAPNVKLVEIDASNWRAVAAVAPRPEQARFVAATTYYLCLGHYGGDWHSLAIESGDSTVGHVMWAVDDADGSVWLGGLVVDAAAQGRGVGRAAVAAFVDRFTKEGNANIALSYSPDNPAARALYRSFAFVETGELEDDEIVARLQRRAPEPVD